MCGGGPLTFSSGQTPKYGFMKDVYDIFFAADRTPSATVPVAAAALSAAPHFAPHVGIWPSASELATAEPPLCLAHALALATETAPLGDRVRRHDCACSRPRAIGVRHGVRDRGAQARSGAKRRR